MPLVPTVLYPLSLPGLLNYLLATQSASTATLLIVCSSQPIFLQQLSESLQQTPRHDDSVTLEEAIEPTLHNLFAIRHIKFAFCASVQALLAYLAAYHQLEIDSADISPRRRLVLVNPLTLHAPTPSFSAQGLSKIFATVVETALRASALLHVVECSGKPRAVEQEQEYEDGEMEYRDDPGEGEADEEDPWEQHVSILNISARRFGSGPSERAWAGRTVKAKRIASRWFRFHKLGNDQSHHGVPEG